MENYRMLISCKRTLDARLKQLVIQVLTRKEHLFNDYKKTILPLLKSNFPFKL